MRLATTNGARAITGLMVGLVVALLAVMGCRSNAPATPEPTDTPTDDPVVVRGSSGGLEIRTLLVSGTVRVLPSALDEPVGPDSDMVGQWLAQGLRVMAAPMETVRGDEGALLPMLVPIDSEQVEKWAAKGVEVAALPVESVPGDRLLAERLEAYPDASMGPRTAAVWRANGFRIVAVPRAELADLLGSLPLGRKVDRQWLGQAPGWVRLFRGQTPPAGQVLELGDGQVSLGVGTLDLLARCWVLPDAQPTDTLGVPAAGNLPGEGNAAVGGVTVDGRGGGRRCGSS
jgi:hypothetical protein